MAAVATLEPLAQTQRAPQDEALYEVVNGQRVELPPLSIYAAWVASRLQNRMGPHAEANGLGTVVTEGLFIIDPGRDLRRRPDVAFVSAQKWPLDRELPLEGDWEMIPDLAVEVVSPNDPFEKVLAKMREYFEYGVGQVWVVVPAEKQIYIYESPTQVQVRTSSEELDGGSLLPGFRLPVAALFQRESKAASS
jgi:Uma2 family endonuclease